MPEKTAFLPRSYVFLGAGGSGLLACGHSVEKGPGQGWIATQGSVSGVGRTDLFNMTHDIISNPCLLDNFPFPRSIVSAYMYLHILQAGLQICIILMRIRIQLFT
jgi:hypothetical protein